MILSFYLDDTAPYYLSGNPFKIFLDFIQGEGIAGEASFIPGIMQNIFGTISRPTSPLHHAFIEQMQRAYQCGLDTHMELMTHDGLYNFDHGTIDPESPHEGLWLHEPKVSVDQYEHYFRNTLLEGERVGVKFTGVTWPGCDCQACEKRYKELRVDGKLEPNPNVWSALLNLAKEGRFRGKTVPCFTFNSYGGGGAIPKAIDEAFGVYDLPPNAGDRFGSYQNELSLVDPDYYISLGGSSGRILDLVRSNAPYCIFYAHWQGLNPTNGVGWRAFQEVVRRIQKYLKYEVSWMRPSAYTDIIHTPLR